ncbi:kelch repeat-containing protein [Kribbella sp. NPDC006257]|uniref:Kelch repeat-containing protein n=1 Tax=Kribbella sp. NPDC006257 TaxID=3156738 RepID=UPI0033BB4F7C
MSIESTSIAAGSWSTAGDLPVAMEWQGQYDGAVLLADGRVLIAGGSGPQYRAMGAAALFTPRSNKWLPTTSLSHERALHSLTRLTDGTVIAAGGGGVGAGQFPSVGLKTVERFNPVLEKWTPTGELIEPRLSHSATLLADGRVLVAGGLTVRSPDSQGTTTSAELYDPIAGTWSTTGAMTDPRSNHQAALLRDGRVLVIGGQRYTGTGDVANLALCEIYNPSTGLWTPTGSLTSPRSLHTATLLRDGTVFVTGGGWPGMVADWAYNAHSDWTTERYDPATGRWSRTEDLPSARTFHRAVALGSGRVLIVAGGNGPTLYAGYRSTAVYDPINRTWTPGAGLHTGRWAATAAELTDGRVIVTGGIENLAWDQPIDESTLTPSTEILTP